MIFFVKFFYLQYFLKFLSFLPLSFSYSPKHFIISSLFKIPLSTNLTSTLFASSPSIFPIISLTPSPPPPPPSSSSSLKSSNVYKEGIDEEEGEEEEEEEEEEGVGEGIEGRRGRPEGGRFIFPFLEGERETLLERGEGGRRRRVGEAREEEEEPRTKAEGERQRTPLGEALGEVR